MMVCNAGKPLMLMLLLALLAVSVSCKPKEDPRWSILLFDSYGHSRSADKATLHQAGTEYIRARGQMIPGKETEIYSESTEYWGTYDFLEYTVEIDCAESRFRYRDATSFMSDGRSLEKAGTSSWSVIARDSAMEIIASALCAG